MSWLKNNVHVIFVHYIRTSNLTIITKVKCDEKACISISNRPTACLKHLKSFWHFYKTIISNFQSLSTFEKIQNTPFLVFTLVQFFPILNNNNSSPATAVKFAKSRLLGSIPSCTSQTSLPRPDMYIHITSRSTYHAESYSWSD